MTLHRIIEHLDIRHCAGVNGSKTNNSIGSVRADLHGTILSHATTAYDRPTT